MGPNKNPSNKILFLGPSKPSSKSYPQKHVFQISKHVFKFKSLSILFPDFLEKQTSSQVLYKTFC
jgi:hypothetical protein